MSTALENFDNWITTLRSGTYAQGLQRLRSVDDKFCCLGVLCDLHQVPCHVPDGILDDDFGYRFTFPYFGEVIGLPPSDFLAQLFEIDYLLAIDMMTNASTWNDDGVNFLEIADLLVESYRHRIPA